MKAKLTTKNQSGFSTLEILIAFVLAILCITAVIGLIFGSQAFAVDSQTDSEATHKAQEMLETARAAAKQNFDLVVSAPPVTEDIYQKTLGVTDLDTFTKQVTATVAWNASNNRALSVQLTTLITNPVAAAGGDTCSQTLAGDWTNPQLLGSADVGQNNGGTDVDVLAHKAYVTADATSGNKPDFYIVDTGNPNLTNLPILGSVDTGPGLAAVHVAGKYAYVADISTTAQLQVIDISVPTAPVVVGSLDVTAPGDTAVGNSIFYFNKRVYLGLTKSTGPEFYVIDVSNPTSLSASSIKASFEINSAVNAITVKNGIAYLAVPDDIATPAISEQLKILNVSQADAGTITANTPFGPNPSTMSGEGLYLSQDGKTLYLGEGGANPGNKPEFYSLNVTNPASISVISSKYIPTSNNITINALAIRTNLAFLWTNDTNLGFQIWDLNNLTSPTPYASLNTQQTSTGGFDCDGNYLYTAQRSQKALQIIGPFIPSSYSLSNSGDISVTQGSSGSNTITATITSGNPDNKSFTASGLPAGATASFGNSPCTPTCSTQLTITTTLATPVGTKTITVTGTGGITTNFNLIVSAQPFDYSLSVPANVTVISGGSSANTSFTTTLTSGNTQAVNFTNSNLPSGVTITYSSTSCSPTCTTTLTLKAAAGATLGSSSVTISGTSPSHNTSFNLTVNAAFDYTLSNSGAITVPKNSTGSNTIFVNLVSGATTPVTLTVSGLPAHTSVQSLAPNPCGPTCSSVLIIKSLNSAISGTYPITVTGSPNGIGPRSTVFNLIIP